MIPSTVVGDLCTGHWTVQDTKEQADHNLFGHNATGLHGFESRMSIPGAAEPAPAEDRDSVDGTSLFPDA